MTPDTTVRSHVNRPRGRWPYAVRQHVRHTWVLPDDRLRPSIDETEFEPQEPPRIEEIDPALYTLSGNPADDRSQIKDFMDLRYEGPATRDYAAKLRRGEPMDPPTVVLDSKGREILGNGGHRAVAALAVGIRRMPVEFYRDDGRAASAAMVARWKARVSARIRARALEGGWRS